MMSSPTASPGLPCVTDRPIIMIHTHFPNQAPIYLRVLKFSLKFLAFFYCNGLHYLPYLPGQLHIAGLSYPLLASFVAKSFSNPQATPLSLYSHSIISAAFV